MSRGLSRKKSTLHIKSSLLDFLIEKINILKSKLYKALIQQSGELVSRYQLKLVKSPLVILLNLHNLLLVNSHYLLDFDVGYFVIFFSSLSLNKTISFNRYYDYIFTDLYIDKQQIATNINTYLVLSVLEVYKKYLLYLDSFSSFKLTEILDMSLFSNKKSISIFNLYSSFYSINFSSLFNQLNLATSLENYLKMVIHKGFFLDYLHFLKLADNLIILRDKEVSILEYILSICTIYITYQVSRMFKIYFFEPSILTENMQVYYHNTNIFLVSSKYERIVYWFYCLKQYLKFNGIISNHNLLAIQLLPMHKTTNLGLHNLQINKKSFYWSLSLLPSLSYQFALLSQIRILFRYSKSKSLFLLIIRFNKILSCWSQFFCSMVKVKLYYLLDYLISIQIRYQKKLLHESSPYMNTNTNLMTLISSNQYLQEKPLTNLVFSRKKYNNLYRQYCLIRLRWMWIC